MFTRRTATVTMSAPDASCAFTMTEGDEYLPVPTMSLEANVFPAITKESMADSLTSADEVDDLNLIAVADLGRVKRGPFQHHQIVFDCDPPRVDLELAEERCDRS